MNDAHFRKLERMYASAPINQIYEPRLTVGTGVAELIMPAKRQLFHAAHAVHGSAYFKALDDAAFFAVNSLVEDVFVLTVTFALYLLKPIAQGTMRATGEVVHETKSTFVAESVLLDDEGTQLARGSGSFVRSRIALTSDIGYR